MFRNALRQSSRTVGAISASGRIAAVRSPHPKHLLDLHFSSSSRSQCIREVHIHSIGALKRWRLMVGSCFGARQAPTCNVFREEAKTNACHFRAEPPLLQLSMLSEPTLPTQRPHQQRSLQFSSREFEVSRRSPVSPRLDESCPSGTSTPNNKPKHKDG